MEALLLFLDETLLIMHVCTRRKQQILNCLVQILQGLAKMCRFRAANIGPSPTEWPWINSECVKIRVLAQKHPLRSQSAPHVETIDASLLHKIEWGIKKKKRGFSFLVFWCFQNQSNWKQWKILLLYPVYLFFFWFSSYNMFSFPDTRRLVLALFGADYFMSKPQIKLFGSGTRSELAIIFGVFFYGLVGLTHFRRDSVPAAFTHRLRLSFPKRGRHRFVFSST